jgi:hypothetical protein
VLAKLEATFWVPSGQTLADVRKRGLLVRFRSGLPARWTLTATMRKTRKLRTTRLHAARGRLVRKTFMAHTGTGTMRLRIPVGRLEGMRTVIIRVQARIQAGGTSLQRSAAVRLGS